MPEATRLIRETTFDPRTVAMMTTVFDSLWATVRYTFDAQGRVEVDVARLTLAKAIIHFASAGQLDPDGLRASVIEAMNLAYPELRSGSRAWTARD